MDEQEDLFEDIEPLFRDVARKYGRSMFALVMNAGMAQQAAQALATLAQKHASRSGLHAVGMLSSAFNQVSNELVQLQGWDEALLAQCDRDIQLAFSHRLVVAGEMPRLDS